MVLGMSKIWDDMLKRIFAARPQDFVQWLLPFAVLVSKAPLELKTLTRTVNADALYEVLIDGQKALFHVEFQRRPNAAMADRLWEYNVLATLAYGCPVYSFVIYLTAGGKVPEPPLTKGLPQREKIHVFCFWDIKLWEVPVEALRSTHLLAVLPLCLLAEGGDQHQVAEAVFDDLVHEKDLLGLALMLAAIVFDREADEEWLERKIAMLEDLVSDSPFYRRILQRGEEKGIREVILNVVQMRFPDLVELAKQQVSRIQDLSLLRQVSMRIIMSESRQEAERVLLDLQGQQDTSGKAPN
jgi:predicted transposase YdaD